MGGDTPLPAVARPGIGGHARALLPLDGAGRRPWYFIATGRVYGGRTLRLGLIAYVELIRGTPILLQLFVLYYGLADAIRLPAFIAALLGWP